MSITEIIKLNEEKVNLIQDTNDVKEGFIEVTGGKVWFKIVGADKNQIPVLLLHGGPGIPHDTIVCNFLKKTENKQY